MRYAWKKARSLMGQFWELWTRDYVSALQTRPKWTKSTPNLLKGQLVLLVDDLRTRDQWKMGSVEEVVSDGAHVRKALIRVPGGGLFERHVNKLFHLELD